MQKNKKKLSSIIKERFVSRSLREQLLSVYEGFERRAQAKKIFKNHLTATQLYNITKTVVTEADSIRDLTIAYNEAKFSSHPVSEEAVKAAKRNLADIKKQL